MKYHNILHNTVNHIAEIKLNRPDVLNSFNFQMEKHLEEFIIANWNQTFLGKEYDIYKDEENYGQQFPTDTGPIDILAISKDKKEVLVVELKKGRASDAVVGQIQRYMGYVTEFIAEDNQQVNTSGMGVSVSIVEHEIFEVSPYRIDPVTEMIWGMTALIGCFGIVLILPLSLYLVAAAKSKKAAEINTINESE